MNRTLFFIIILAAVIITAVFMRSCQPAADTVVKRDTVWITHTDTIYKEKLVPVEKIVNHTTVPVTVRDTLFISEMEHVDTTEILKDYFATRKYADTNKIEGYGNIIINDDITQNKIKNREIMYNLKFPEVTNTIIEQKRKGFLGLDFGFGNNVAMGGLQFTYIDRKDNMIHFRSDFTTMGTFFFGGGIDWKISLFKK